MNLSDDFFKKVENKTNVSKDTIISLANKLNQGKMNDEKTIREVIDVLSKATGKKVSKEKADKIVAKVVKNDVPNNVDKMF
jgi:uncharacterized protein (DUF2267 family)